MMGFMSSIVVWCASFCEFRIFIDEFSIYFIHSSLIIVLDITGSVVNQRDKVLVLWSLHLVTGDKNI